MTDIRRENGKRTTLYMHRLIFNAPAGLQVDHRDGNGLNNIRSNLRLATRLENGKNRRMQSNNACGLKGVCQRKDNDKWVATIRVEGRNLHLGTFSTADEAHAAYCAASASYHGEFGRTA
ncbi:hypothetical protein HF290_02705 [Acidithiobacillus ferrooxidans]|nr:hypothetical protein [Acidithiobacillus ferrooxidans]